MKGERAALAHVPTAVYRFYDGDDQLLYIGITHSIEKRWASHERNQPWWLDVKRREVAWYGTRAEAEVIEDISTAAETPRYDRAGQRTIGGEVDQRLAAETDRAVDAISDDLEKGTYPLWSILPSYGELSERYGIPIIGITRGLARVANRSRNLVHAGDRFAVAEPGCRPSRDALKIGLSYFLASNAFGDMSFTRSDLADTIGVNEVTAHHHLQRWERADRVERLPKVPGCRAFVYRIIRHPDPDPPKVLTVWRQSDVRALAEWLNQQLDAEASAAGPDVDRDREIVAACLPGSEDYGVSNTGLRVLKVMARRYRQRAGCRPEWGIG